MCLKKKWLKKLAVVVTRVEGKIVVAKMVVVVVVGLPLLDQEEEQQSRGKRKDALEKDRFL